MGLFTNRKRKDGEEDLVDPSRAFGLPVDEEVDDVEPVDHSVGAATPDALPEPEAVDPVLAPGGAFDDVFAQIDQTASVVETSAVVDSAPAVDPAPVVEVEPMIVPEAAAPISDVDTPIVDIAEPIVDDIPPMPQRRLADRPRAQAGNVEIDAEGLLALLGLDADADLLDVSDAHLRFVADHAPSDTDDHEAAQIKERIRREVKSAYASFRLTRVD